MDGQNFNNEQNEQNNYYENSTTVTQDTTVAEAAPNKADALAIISLVAGILSIVLCCAMYWAFIPGILGIVFSIISSKNNGKTGVAKAGLICSIVGMVLALLWLIVGVGLLAMIGMSEYASYM